MSYVTLSGPVMFKASNEGYIALMNVASTPRLICTIRKYNVTAASANMLYLHGGDQTNIDNIEDMKAMLNFIVAFVNHGNTIRLVNNDALTMAIALQAAMKSTNAELQDALDNLNIVMGASASVGTAVNTMRFDKGMIKTFNPVALANATEINLVLSQN
jgi:hypothetical protein